MDDAIAGDGYRASHALASTGALSVGAGLLHLAAAPAHAGSSVVLALGFAAVGLAQIAVAALLIRRPGRVSAIAVTTIHLLAVGTWAISRSVGLPLGHAGPEPIALADGLTVAFEVTALGGVALWWTGWLDGSRRVLTVLGLAGVIALAGASAGSADLLVGHGHGDGHHAAADAHGHGGEPEGAHGERDARDARRETGDRPADVVAPPDGTGTPPELERSPSPGEPSEDDAGGDGHDHTHEHDHARGGDDRHGS